MNELPMLRLELDNVKFSVIHALQNYNQEIEQYVEKELNKIVDEFDYKSTIENIANTVIKKSVEDVVTSYFSYGEGRDIIKELVSEKLMPKT